MNFMNLKRSKSIKIDDKIRYFEIIKKFQTYDDLLIILEMYQPELEFTFRMWQIVQHGVFFFARSHSELWHIENLEIENLVWQQLKTWITSIWIYFCLITKTEMMKLHSDQNCCIWIFWRESKLFR